MTTAIIQEILDGLAPFCDEKYRQGLTRFGIPNENALGIRMPHIKAYAKQIGKDYELSLLLEQSNHHELKLLAYHIADVKKMSIDDVLKWRSDFYSWDTCDQCVMNVFKHLPNAQSLALDWIQAKREFEKRAGFVLMATLAMHAKKWDDNEFLPYIEVCLVETDERNFVKKAVSWALRQIGKRSLYLNGVVTQAIQPLLESENSVQRWIGRDTFSDISRPEIITRLEKKAGVI